MESPREPIDYSNRQLSTVTVSDITRLIYSDQTTGMTGHVEVRLTSMDGGRYGPAMQFTVNIATAENPSLHDAERALLRAAMSFMQRCSKETVETLERSMLDYRAEPGVSND